MMSATYNARPWPWPSEQHFPRRDAERRSLKLTNSNEHEQMNMNLLDITILTNNFRYLHKVKIRVTNFTYKMRIVSMKYGYNKSKFHNIWYR